MQVRLFLRPEGPIRFFKAKYTWLWWFFRFVSFVSDREGVKRPVLLVLKAPFSLSEAFRDKSTRTKGWTVTASESALAQSFIWAQLQKAKRQVRLHNRALDHVWGTFDNCLGAFLDRLWFSPSSISRKREKRGANHCRLFRIKGTLGFFFGSAWERKRGGKSFSLDPPFNLFLSFSLFCFGPSYPPPFFLKKRRREKGKEKRHKKRDFFIWCLFQIRKFVLQSTFSFAIK